MKEIKSLSKKNLDIVEKEMFLLLSEDQSMVEVEDIMACDMYNETAGLKLRQYRSMPDIYMRITQELRAEILEDNEPSADCVFMMWLMRETGILHDIFSSQEQIEVNMHLTELCAQNELYLDLFSKELFSSDDRLSIKFLKMKSNLFTNPFLEGVNLIFPFLERRKAIFIDMTMFKTTALDRRKSTIVYLQTRGHLAQEVRIGEEVLLKIDNSFYRIVPITRICSRLPIQGINLVPFYR